MAKYLIITEAALDTALVSGAFSGTNGLPETGNGICKVPISDEIVGFRTFHDREITFSAVVGTAWIDLLLVAGGTPQDIFQRVARVLKGLKSPPVHLPRQWAEYHHRNLLAFFALPRDVANMRWIVELGGGGKTATFDHLTSDIEEVALSNFIPSDTADKFAEGIKKLLEAEVFPEKDALQDALVQKFDLEAIGSGSVVAGRTYGDWERLLTDQQLEILGKNLETPIRIVGPAGSGKTLSLCMRALQISRDPAVTSQGKRVLVATHSWAMSERIDGVLSVLNAGIPPDRITVFPLLSLLELHAGHIGQRKTEIIGDDSTSGRVKSLEIIGGIISRLDSSKFSEISQVLLDGMLSDEDSRNRIDLIINLYEEITGVIAASGVSPDDPNSIQGYVSSKREDWMPPFVTVSDRAFAVSVYRQFIQHLVDRGAITTDQFVLDSIRVLETFTWRMKKETEGYDYVVVDELQLFDSQERSALELLGRSRKGVPFITAEDPSQGVFAALNMRRANVDNVPVYLDTVHRFNREIFNFINFLYNQFPLNALALRIADGHEQGYGKPQLIICPSNEDAVDETGVIIEKLSREISPDQRICIIALGDVELNLLQTLHQHGLTVSRLESFDDVEQLSYKRRSIVVSPWQFIGGTQFAHVIVLALGINEQLSQFGKLREMIAVYLSCSRAADTLKIVCAGYVPPMLHAASEQGLLQTIEKA